MKSIKNRLQDKVLILLFIILSIGGPRVAYASHYAAVDLYVTYIGAGQNGCTGTTEYKYQVVLQVYAVCASGSSPIGVGEQLRIASASLGLDTGVNLNLTDPAVSPFLTVVQDTVDQLCPAFSAINSCHINANSQYPGYARVTYTFTVSLNYPPQTDWRFYWTSGARGNTITNLASPGSLNIYVEAGLDNQTRYNSSTPRYTEVPFPYICVNQPAIYLNSPLDLNNDSLDTYPQTPLNSGPTTLCPYAGTFTYLDPVGATSANPYRVNRFTGTTTFTPTTTGKFVLSFRTDKYDKKTKKRLGYIMRDAAVSIFDCTTPPPPIDSIPVSIANATYVKGPNAVFVCPGSNMSFNVSSQSSSATAELYMRANTAAVLPAASFVSTGDGTNSVKGTFSWTPTTNDYGDHTIIVTSLDSTCTGSGFSLVLKNYQVVLLRVVRGLDAGPDLPICKINRSGRQLSVTGADDLSIKWTDIDGGPAQGITKDNIPNPIADPGKTVTYVIKTPDLAGTCRNIDTVSVYVDTSNTLDVFPQNPLVLCRPDYLQLDAIVTGTGPLTNQACGLNKNPAGLCAVPDSFAVFGSPLYGRIAYDTTGGAPTLYNVVRTSKQQFLILKSELREYGIRSATLRSLSFETDHTGEATYAYNNFRISLKCTAKDKLNAGAGFDGNMTNVYTSGRIQMPDGIHKFDFDYPYDLDSTLNLLVEFCYSSNDSAHASSCVSPKTPPSPIIKYAPTTYASYLSYFPTRVDTKSPTFEVIPDTIIADQCGLLTNNSISQKNLRPVIGFTYCDAPSSPFSINWSPGIFLSDSTIMQPLSYVPKSVVYTMETIGKSGCVLRDSVDVYMPVHNFIVSPRDSAICLGETAPMLIENGFAYIWHEYENNTFIPAKSLSCADCADPIAKPNKTTTYKIEVADSVWCFDTLTVTLNVLPLPKVHILNNDTIIRYGQPIQLLVNGARTYNWTPVGSLNNPNISYPIATPTESTLYSVAGIGANGCRSYDTVRVGIDYRDNLFIPSAFTPNGDGKNDEFHVANLTFQRIMEFRVFNRWGQEIFNTTDSKHGWDGMWKGVPQDMGDYQYLIRIGYPDGLVETYKGNVALIR